MSAVVAAADPVSSPSVNPAATAPPHLSNHEIGEARSYRELLARRRRLSVRLSFFLKLFHLQAFTTTASMNTRDAAAAAR